MKVLHEVEKGHLTQKRAAAQLSLTERWVRKLLGRLRRAGDRGVVHRSRGQPSNRKLPEEWRARARVQETYRDFGLTLAGGVIGEAGRDPDQQGDAAAVVDGAGGVEGPAVDEGSAYRMPGLQERGEEPYLIIMIAAANRSLRALKRGSTIFRTYRES